MVVVQDEVLNVLLIEKIVLGFKISSSRIEEVIDNFS